MAKTDRARPERLTPYVVGLDGWQLDALGQLERRGLDPDSIFRAGLSIVLGLALAGVDPTQSGLTIRVEPPFPALKDPPTVGPAK